MRTAGVAVSIERSGRWPASGTFQARAVLFMGLLASRRRHTRQTGWRPPPVDTPMSATALPPIAQARGARMARAASPIGSWGTPLQSVIDPMGSGAGSGSCGSHSRAQSRGRGGRCCSRICVTLGELSQPSAQAMRQAPSREVIVCTLQVRAPRLQREDDRRRRSSCDPPDRHARRPSRVVNRPMPYDSGVLRYTRYTSCSASSRL